MNEIKSVQFRLKSDLPKLSSDANDAFEDAFLRLVDLFGVPEAVNIALSYVESFLDGILFVRVPIEKDSE